MTDRSTTTRVPVSRRCALLLAAAGAWSGLAEEARATVLVFDESRDAATGTTVVSTTSGADIQQDYGDRVTGSPMNVTGGQFTYGNAGEGYTPNVTVDYYTGNVQTTPRLWASQYGDLTNVMFAWAPVSGAIASGSLNVRLNADPGYAALLYHFDLGGWANDYTINAVSVADGATTLFSQSNVLVEGDANGPGHSAFDFTTPLSGQQLVIQIDFSNLAAGIQDNIGIDNIRFGQLPPAPVPVPAAVWFLGSGVGAWLTYARRRSGGARDARRPPAASS